MTVRLAGAVVGVGADDLRAWRRLRVLVARARGRSRDMSKKSLDIVLIVPPLARREARQWEVTLKNRQPLI